MTRKSVCNTRAFDRAKLWTLDDGYMFHREYGPAIEYVDGSISFWINGNPVHLDEVIDDIKFKNKYPELITSMLVYSVHKS
jgi:hypothetical protein